MEQNTKTLADYVDLVTRRKYYNLMTWVLVSLVSVIVAYDLPKIYRATATILIEAPISTKVVESSVSQFAEEQIQAISQRVMTNNNVLSIIEAHGLYKNAKEDFSFRIVANGINCIVIHVNDLDVTNKGATFFLLHLQQVIVFHCDASMGPQRFASVSGIGRLPVGKDVSLGIY